MRGIDKYNESEMCELLDNIAFFFSDFILYNFSISFPMQRDNWSLHSELLREDMIHETRVDERII